MAIGLNYPLLFQAVKYIAEIARARSRSLDNTLADYKYIYALYV